MLRPLTHLSLAVMLAFAGFSCLPAVAAAPIRIVTAENFYGDLARQIGGASVEVTSILANPNDDPHLFESSSSTARNLADADIVVYNGAGYDPWMDSLLAATDKPSRVVLSVAKLTTHANGDNPHLWYDPATFPAVAKALDDELAKRDPGTPRPSPPTATLSTSVLPRLSPTSRLSVGCTAACRSLPPNQCSAIWRGRWASRCSTRASSCR